MFGLLHPQLFPVIFDYLTQQELLDIAFLCQIICANVIKYITPRFEDKYNTKTETLIKRKSAVDQKNHIKYMILFEHIFPFMSLCQYIRKYGDKYLDGLYGVCVLIWRYLYKFGKQRMIDYAKRCNIRRVDSGILSGALAAGNTQVIYDTINDLRFYNPNIISVITSVLYHCKNAKTYDFVCRQFDRRYEWDMTFCHHNRKGLIEYLSKDGVNCSNCGAPIVSHLPYMSIQVRNCVDNDLKKIRKHSSDGLTCSYCNVPISVHHGKK